MWSICVFFGCVFICGVLCVFLGPALSPELSTVEQVDLLLLKNDSGVESALLYAKAWSKYTKDVLAWVEKRLSLGQSILKA